MSCRDRVTPAGAFGRRAGRDGIQRSSAFNRVRPWDAEFKIAESMIVDRYYPQGGSDPR
jgi:hypothetical protein